MPAVWVNLSPACTAAALPFEHLEAVAAPGQALWVSSPRAHVLVLVHEAFL